MKQQQLIDKIEKIIQENSDGYWAKDYEVLGKELIEIFKGNPTTITQVLHYASVFKGLMNILNYFEPLGTEEIQFIPFLAINGSSHNLRDVLFEEQLVEKIRSVNDSHFLQNWAERINEQTNEDFHKVVLLALSEGKYLYLNRSSDKILLESARNYILSILDTHQQLILDIFEIDRRDTLIEILANEPNFNGAQWIFEDQKKTELNIYGVQHLLKHNFEKYEQTIWEIYQDRTQKGNTDKTYFLLYFLLQGAPEKYTETLLQTAKSHLLTYSNMLFYKPEVEEGLYLDKEVIQILIDIDKDDFWTFVPTYFKNTGSYGLSYHILDVIHDAYGEKVVDEFGVFLDKSKSSFWTELNILSKYEHYEKYKTKIWALIGHSNREDVINHLVALGERVLPDAAIIFSKKKRDVFRKSTTEILGKIGTPAALDMLQDQVNIEKNDTVRELMLHYLGDRMSKGVSYDFIEQMIDAAEKRGKLQKMVQPWLTNEELKLYWKNGAQLNEKEMCFLFYRMSRAKGITIDAEALPVLNLIDKEKSEGFAQQLFKLYKEVGGADTKSKYCLTLCGYFGNEDTVDDLKKLLVHWVNTNKGKRAEYATSAISFIESEKALRTLDFIARKYKKPSNISSAALEALEETAKKLNLTADELADRIIPNLGFEDNFYSFEVENTPFRASIGMDFKLRFINDDTDKVYKSVPSKASKEQKTVFKTMAKELRELVKIQDQRLNEYITTQRKWNGENWQKVFLTNPVMMIYANRLIWGLFDDKGIFKGTFQCLEDGELCDIHDDEIELTENDFVSIIHPVYLSNEVLTHWGERLSEEEIPNALNQLSRPIYKWENSGMDKYSNEFNGKPLGYVQKLKKVGWQAEVADGGSIPYYYKVFPEFDFQVVIEIENYGIGWEDNPKLGKFSFYKMGKHAYYMSNKEANKYIIPLSEIPLSIYSGVIEDIKKIVKAS